MTEEFFLCQKSYGNTTRLKNFDRQKKISVSGSGRFRRTNQKSLRYDQRPPYMIFWKQGNFCESKLLWLYNGLKFIFERFSLKKKSVTGSGRFGRTNQKSLRYDQRPSYMILWKQGNFCESKLLWLYNGLKFIFERFFSLRDNQSKMGFKLRSKAKTYPLE